MSWSTQEWQKKLLWFRLQDFHLLWCSFPETSAITTICNFLCFAHYHHLITPIHIALSTWLLTWIARWNWFGLLPFRSPLLREFCLVSVPPGTEMFHFPGSASYSKCKIIEVYSIGFPHSEISGSKVIRHLPETYRRHIASFIAIKSLGIRRAPLLSY